MVGIVIVSHSAQVAEGAVELAREMAGPDVLIVAAGGLDLPGHPLGTDAVLVARAMDQAWSDDGVLVLMDLGSAVMSAEMAVDLMPEERQSRLLLRWPHAWASHWPRWPPRRAAGWPARSPI